MNRDDLDRALIEAHQSDDKLRLVDLYKQAAQKFELEGDIGAACFYLTHAFVYALEIGDERAAALNQRLVKYGRAHSIG